MKKQAGFTLVELVVVLAVVGVMAAVAVPKFIDVRDDAKQSTVTKLAGGLSSAASFNYNARVANTTYGVAVTSCADVEKALQGGALPAGYAITGGAIPTQVAGTPPVNGTDKTDCVLTHSASGKTANFTAIYIP